VIPLVGPSSIFLALAASGLDGQHFSFLGYLPSDREGRRAALRAIDRGIAEDGATRIFIEAPYRNVPLLTDLINTLSDQTRLCIACDITLETEYIKTQTVAQWRNGVPDLNKRPTIFLIQKD
jgi:16S rRNA (cytidine1402-2'-O)-methyltransferase